MTATVEIRLMGGNLGPTMSQMRMWLDHQKVRTHAFRESRFPGGLALHVDFASSGEADAFAARFGGRVLGTRGLWAGAGAEPAASDGAQKASGL
jgi:hypothetical protein